MKKFEGSDIKTQENNEDKYLDETPNEFNLATISITINEIKIKTACSCKFKKNCLKSLFESGATGHVINNKNILKSSKTEKKFHN
eukprot:snap_masked-scaffold_80-processed-gene-0.8-mRNA-1 protein AED:1.00 eAED:1.00 QI:0/-1/0/0/-1/1/1/0/84